MNQEKKDSHSELGKRLRALRDALPEAKRAELDRNLKAGHDHLVAIRNGNPIDVGTAPNDALLAHSLIHGDPDHLIGELESIATHVDGSGQIYFGDVDYDMTDPGWAYTLFAWYETEGKTPPFHNARVCQQIPDTVKISLLGDWGGKNAGSQAVADLINPEDHVIHLGDVYYAGTNQSGVIERDYEHEKFLDVWPGKAGRSFALNSNHDMYAHGTGYFESTLTSPVFQAQQGCSYFALHNTGFRIVGLDTAYYDKHQSGYGFMAGDLGPDGPHTQAAFLAEQAELAAASGQTLILLSHHTGLSVDGSGTTPLWNQVMAKLTAMRGHRVIWYWGHEHVGAVYKTRIESDIQVLPRCCGHSCIPWGVATNLRNSNVTWFEQTVLGPGSDYFVANGYAELAFDGPILCEVFYRQGGGESWSSAAD